MALVGPRRSLSVTAVRMILVGAAAILLAFLAARSAAYAVAIGGGPCIPAATECSRGEIGLLRARGELQQLHGARPPAGALLPGAAREAPLSAMPLVYAGLIALHDHQQDRARALMSAAMARDPRSPEGRSFLLDEALRGKRYAAVFLHGDRLYRTVPAIGPRIVQLFAALATVPAARPALGAALAANPPWRGAMFDRIRSQGSNPAIAFQLLGNDPHAGADVTRDQQAKLVRELVEAGDYERGYLAWANFLPPAALGSVAYLYDGDFKGMPGVPPFNWLLMPGAEAAVDIEGGGLVVQYYGRAPERLAQEAMVAPPGDYVLQLTATTDTPGVESSLIWRLRCYQDQSRILFELPMTGLGDRPVRRQVGFTVPAACAAQLLTLDGTPTELAQTFSTKIERITVARATPATRGSGR